MEVFIIHGHQYVGQYAQRGSNALEEKQEFKAKSDGVLPCIDLADQVSHHMSAVTRIQNLFVRLGK